ncbi:hypothetical protein BC834DRAFT_283801 [Gloeopeniophorella convolvens]|nr:hypothetical protein BC834DRAFT_283801 [Gloeopeniophorella convolvens]
MIIDANTDTAACRTHTPMWYVAGPRAPRTVPCSRCPALRSRPQPPRARHHHTCSCAALVRVMDHRGGMPSANKSGTMYVSLTVNSVWVQVRVSGLGSASASLGAVPLSSLAPPVPSIMLTQGRCHWCLPKPLGWSLGALERRRTAYMKQVHTIESSSGPHWCPRARGSLCSLSVQCLCSPTNGVLVLRLKLNAWMFACSVRVARGSP